MESNDRSAPSLPKTIRMVTLKNLKGEVALRGRVSSSLPGKQRDARQDVGLRKPDLGSNPSLPSASCVNWETESNLLMGFLSRSNLPRTWASKYSIHAHSSCFPLTWRAPGERDRKKKGTAIWNSPGFVRSSLHLTLRASL